MINAPIKENIATFPKDVKTKSVSLIYKEILQGAPDFGANRVSSEEVKFSVDLSFVSGIQVFSLSCLEVDKQWVCVNKSR